MKIATTIEARTHIVDRNEVRTYVSTTVYEASLSKLRNVFYPHELRPPTNVDGHGGFWRLDVNCDPSLPDSDTCASENSRTTYQGPNAHPPEMSEVKRDGFQLSFCNEENAHSAKAAFEELISAAKASPPPPAPTTPSVTKDTVTKNSKGSRQAKTKSTSNNGDPITSITINTEPLAK